MQIDKRALTPPNLLIQAAFVLALFGGIAAFGFTAHRTLEAQHITAGFSFLRGPTGWDIGYSVLPISIRSPYWWTLLAGMVNTLAVGILANILATLLGLCAAVMRLYGNVVMRTLSKAYVEVVRNVPPLLQLFVWYAVFTSFPPPRHAWQPIAAVLVTARGISVPWINVGYSALCVMTVTVCGVAAALLYIGFAMRLAFVPVARRALMSLSAVVLGLLVIAVTLWQGVDPSGPELVSLPVQQGLRIAGGLQLPPELTAILVSTTVFGGGYAAEIIRGGFLSIEAGKVEAGKALGMSGWSIFSRIQLPLVIANVLPMMTNLYVWLIKATTLGIAIGFADFFMVTVSSINQSGQTIELLVILAAGFWLINNLFVIGMYRASNRIAYWK